MRLFVLSIALLAIFPLGRCVAQETIGTATAAIRDAKQEGIEYAMKRAEYESWAWELWYYLQGIAQIDPALLGQDRLEALAGVDEQSADAEAAAQQAESIADSAGGTDGAYLDDSFLAHATDNYDEGDYDQAVACANQAENLYQTAQSWLCGAMSLLEAALTVAEYIYWEFFYGAN